MRATTPVFHFHSVPMPFGNAVPAPTLPVPADVAGATGSSPRGAPGARAAAIAPRAGAAVPSLQWVTLRVTADGAHGGQQQR